MRNIFTPKKGSILISEPFMLDANFERSVVLVCAHDIEGTLGLVMNNKSDLALSDIMPGVSSNDFPVYLGGPVNSDNLFFIHDKPDDIAGSLRIVEDICFGGDINDALRLMDLGVIKPENIKFMIGCAGWSPTQLEEEIADNSWVVHNKFPSEILLLSDGDDLWKQAIINLGPKYAHVASFPKSPNLN